jgi:hypothetical protein
MENWKLREWCIEQAGYITGAGHETLDVEKVIECAKKLEEYIYGINSATTDYYDKVNDYIDKGKEPLAGQEFYWDGEKFIELGEN